MRKQTCLRSILKNKKYSFDVDFWYIITTYMGSEILKVKVKKINAHYSPKKAQKMKSRLQNRLRKNLNKQLIISSYKGLFIEI